MIHGELIVDNFAGGGGASTGIELATGYSVDIAINHDPEAIRIGNLITDCKGKQFKQCYASLEQKPEYMHIRISSGEHCLLMQELEVCRCRRYKLMPVMQNPIRPCYTYQLKMKQ